MTYFAWATVGDTPRFIGPVNPRSGKRSQAGCLSVFERRQDRDRFIEQTNGKAVAVTAQQARELKAGLDLRTFNQLVAVLLGGEQ
ncbi:hypothetical protein ACTG16_12040 [Aeromonas sp. 23P]|uniref:hypothetical protein n=1 Tax=unclassified Aeromonas TaxID=257493 RepID=UPI003F7A8C0A